MDGIIDTQKNPDQVADPSGPAHTDPQPAPSTPTQPDGDPQKHQNDPIKINPEAPFKNPAPGEPGFDEKKASSGQQAGASPSFKYKVDKEEREFEDWAKPLVNAENEQKFKRLFESAHGIEKIKERYKQRSDEYQQVRQQYDNVQKDLNQLSQYLQNGDLGSFFESVKIPEDMVYKYVLDKLKMAELPPEQRQIYEQSEQARREKYMLQQQNQQLKEQYESVENERRRNMLDQALSRPEVTGVMESFDSRFGKPGTFREEVIKRGVLHEKLYGQTITPEQAVAEVLQLSGHQWQPQSPGAAQPPVNGMHASMQSNPAEGRPPVIPNVSGRSSSPARKTVKSLEDIRNAQQMAG